MFIALAAIAAGLAGAGTYIQYQAQQRQAEYQQEVARNRAQYQQEMAEYNAEVQQQKARREEQAAIRKELEIRRQGQATIGKQRSLLAQSGVSMTQGSPLETLAETSADIEHEVEVASFEGKMRARSRRSVARETISRGEMQKRSSLAKAEMAGMRADTAETMKYVGAARSGAQSLLKGG